MNTANLPTSGTSAYYVLDFGWRIQQVSSAAEIYLFRRPAEDLLGKVLWHVNPDLADTPLYRYLHQAAAEQTAVQFEMVLLDTWYEVHAYPWQDRIEVFQQDITHRKQIFSRLQSIARFPFENPNPVLRIGEEGIIQYANTASQALLMQWNCQVGQPLPKQWAALILDTLDSGQGYVAETACGDRFLALNFVPIVEARYVNIYASDVTSRKHAEAALMRNEARATMLQELTAALATTLTTEQVADTIISTVSRAVGAQFGIVAVLDDEKQVLQILNTDLIPRSLVEPYRTIPLTASLPIADAVRAEQQIWIRTFEEYQQRYPDLAHAVQAQTQTRAIIALPMYVQDRNIGGVGFSFREPQLFSDEEQTFYRAVAQQCAQAIERAQLYHQAQALAALQERERLARDLHDAVSQSLFSASLIAGTLLRQSDGMPDRLAAHLEQLHLLVRGALAEMRTLLLELRPTALIEAGFHTLLEQLILAAQSRKIMGVTSTIDSQLVLPTDIKLAFYRIAQESLNNITKHAQATQVTIFYGIRHGAAELSIEDNGRGFDVTAIPPTNLGLKIMHERAEGVGARLEVRSQLGQGTTVVVTWKEAT